MRWAAIFLLSACGRLGYDPVDVTPDVPPVCAADTVPLSLGSQVCIEIVERGELPWTDAVMSCAGLGRRLCTDAEWFEGCVNATALVDMIDGGFEWVAEESAGVAQKRGSTDCTVMSSHAIVDPYEYRCCADL